MSSEKAEPTGHNCEPFTAREWICTDCGARFERGFVCIDCLLDPSMMDHECEFESAIIEGECVSNDLASIG